MAGEVGEPRLGQAVGAAGLVVAGGAAVGPVAGAVEDAGSPYGLTQTVLANLTGHPAISLPAGVSGLGLPWGLQVLAGRWQDRALLTTAEAWERAHPWPRTAPGFTPFDSASRSR